MKKILSLINVIAAFVLLLTISCRNDYLSTAPTDSIDTGTATASADNLMNIINGMHRDLYYRQNSNQGQTGEGALMIMRDALGEDMVFPSSGNGWFISTVRWQDQNNENGSNDFFPYQFYYALIRNANIIINNGSSATGDQDTKNRAIAEAYTFRAYCHFMLVQYYGSRYVPNTTNSQLGVPIKTVVDEAPKARNTVEEVYSQINKDLDQAIAIFGTTGSRLNKSHFNLNVAQGIKARVALTQGNYQVAITNAQAARAGFSLMSNSDYISGFNTISNVEWLWGTQIVADQTDYFGNFGAYMSRNYNSTNIRTAPKAISKTLYSKFPSTDIRTKVFDPTGYHVGLLTYVPTGATTPVKYPAYNSYALYPYTSQKFLAVSQSDSRMDVPYMRAAEMYLIEAEAQARLGNEAASKLVFNAFAKNRNPSYAGATTTGAAYINEILDSRRMELWGEGFRYLDLKRLGQGLDRTGSNHVATVVNNVLTVDASDNRWQYLIPKAEIDASGGLVVQNPK